MTIEERLARMEERSEHLIKKVDSIKDTIGKIFDKLNTLPCGKMSERVKGLSIRVNWLYFAFVIVILGGVVLGVWINGGPK